MFPSQSFNQYAVGSKVYNGGSSAPNIMPLGRSLGRAENNLAETSARRNALLRRLQAGQQGKHMSANWLGGNPRA